MRTRWLLAITGVVSWTALACTNPPPVPVPTPTAVPASGQASPGASQSSAVAITKMPACELVFKAEAGAAIGTTLEAAQPQESTADDGVGWLSDCVYWRHSYFDEAPLEITLASGPSYVARFNDLMTQPDATTMSGLGDEGFLRLSPIFGLDQPVGSYFVRLGDGVLSVSLGIVDLGDDGQPILAGDATKQQQILTDLAGLAVQRLTSPPPPAQSTCGVVPLADVAPIVAAAGGTLTTTEDADEHDVWGPACHYGAGDQFFEIYLSANSQPTAAQHFETCKQGSQAVPGLGDDAFYDRARTCPVQVGFSFYGRPVLIRSGDTVVAVALREGGLLDNGSPLATLTAVARVALQRLGLDAGATVPPINADALAHPCNLLSDAEVRAAITGAAITSHAEWSADASGLNALCIYATDDYSVNPLQVNIGHGEEALNGFTQDKSFEDATTVPGIGDEAFERHGPGQTDQPLVSLYVRSGETVVNLSMGPVRQSDDFLSFVAAGTPAEQLEMLHELANLVLPRLSGS